MTSHDDFLKLLWNDIINNSAGELWIDNVIKNSKLHPNAPFSDVGTSLLHLLDLGAERDDLRKIVKLASYEAVYGTLETIEDQGLSSDDLEGVHEQLLSADPSGREGRPGSWPL